MRNPVELLQSFRLAKATISNQARQSYAGVWIIARVPEQDLALIDTGLAVRLEFPSAPGAPAEGRINYIYPTIDPRTRTGEVRIEVNNAAGYLRPGAYADISMDLGGEARLSAPTEAILRDSRGAHVIVALGQGRFAGRSVQTGIAANGQTEIITGLQSGDLVVASGQFMLDSEVNLREGFSKLQAPVAVASGPDTPLAQLPVDASTLTEIDHFTDMALYFHEALTDGYKIDPYFVDPALGLGETLRARFADTKLITILERAEIALREAGTDRLWLQEGPVPSNPYGDGKAETVSWPDPMAGMAISTGERPQIDPHAGHR